MLSTMAGYSGTPLPRKLGVKEGHIVALVDAPRGFRLPARDMPKDVTVRTDLRGRGQFDVIVLFSTARRDAERRLDGLERRLAMDGGLVVGTPIRAPAEGPGNHQGALGLSMANQDKNGDAQVTVRIGTDHYSADVQAGGHGLKADEPAAAGGQDTGPDPYALLLSSLGACKAITMRMYADRKGWPLESALVSLSHGRVHAKDCEDCETAGGMVDVIDCRIELTGELSDEQRARIVEIADKCPVHRTLTSETKVRTTAG